MRRFAPQIFAQLFCLPLLLLLVTDSRGQFPIKPRTGRQVIQNHDLVVPQVRNEVSPQYQLIAELALRADFRKLQILNIDLLRRMHQLSSKAMDKKDQKQIRSTLAEIKKVATRLATNLDIPKPDEELPSYDLELMEGALRMDKAITSFVENPLFQELRVVDPELTLQAGKDIREVQQLSEFLRELAKEK